MDKLTINDSQSNNEKATEKAEFIPPAYYWRDYFGVIPDDAVVGGYDIAGCATYIGQGLFENYGILPGRIEKEFNVNLTVAAYFTSPNASKSGRTQKLVKILCSNLPHKLTWIKTCPEDISKLTGHHLIAGGITPDNHILYIGRVFHDRCTVVGSVLVSGSYVKGIYIPDERDKSQVLPNFEILSYEN